MLGGHHLTDRQIGVIIPVYNCREYLQQAVDSVISQPYEAIKVVLIDDGSTDGSSLLCDELAKQDKRINVIHQKNKGVAEARNEGLRYFFSIDEKIDYIAFLDADDAWTDDWMDDEIRKSMEEKIDLIGLQSCKCDHLLKRRTKSEKLQEGVYKGGTSSIWIYPDHFGAMLYGIHLIKKYGIRFYNINASEDKIFLMQCLYLADKIYLVNQLMYFYRQNATSTIHMRNRGIAYFVPIIDAYIQSDLDMSRWSNHARGKLQEGKLLAKIYIMDMIEEELENIHGTKRLIELSKRKLDYWKIAAAPTNSPEIDARWIYICKHKRKCILKNLFRGFMFKVVRKIYHFGLVKYVVDWKRYPIKIE